MLQKEERVTYIHNALVAFVLTAILLFIFVWLLTAEPILCHISYHWGHLQQHFQAYPAPTPLLPHSHPSPHCPSAQYTKLSRIKICITSSLCPILFFCSCPHCVSELQHSSLHSYWLHCFCLVKITSSTITLMMEFVLQWSGTLDFMALWMTQLLMTLFM